MAFVGLVNTPAYKRLTNCDYRLAKCIALAWIGHGCKEHSWAGAVRPLQKRRCIAPGTMNTSTPGRCAPTKHPCISPGPVYTSTPERCAQKNPIHRPRHGAPHPHRVTQTLERLAKRSSTQPASPSKPASSRKSNSFSYRSSRSQSRLHFNFARQIGQS